MLENKLFGVISLGCDKNRVDSEKLIGLLKERKCALTDDLSKAQIVIVNTCAFLESARKESIETILECAGYKKSGKLEKIVVTGCLPQKFIGELFDPLTEADVFLGIRDYEKIFEALEKSYERNERENYVGKGSDGFRFGRVLTTEPHYAYLKIADGCYNHCTYCLIPKIRGRYVSYPMEDLLKEAEELGDVSELIVVAQDTTRYGEDLYGESRFVNLLSELSKLDNIRKIRLLYCYPDVIGEELIAEIRDNDKILKYIDIPLQHSENRILKLMNRKGGRESYLALLKKLREEIPQIAVRSTFISGFPGETEEDYLATERLVREADFASAFTFVYSPRTGTKAASMPDQIPESVQKDRIMRLVELVNSLTRKKSEKYLGKTVEILCEDYDKKKGLYLGRDEFGRMGYFKSETNRIGDFVNLKITQANGISLFGETAEKENKEI